MRKIVKFVLQYPHIYSMLTCLQTYTVVDNNIPLVMTNLTELYVWDRATPDSILQITII